MNSIFMLLSSVERRIQMPGRIKISSRGVLFRTPAVSCQRIPNSDHSSATRVLLRSHKTIDEVNASVLGSSVMNPWANPFGTYIILRFSAESVSLNHLPNVGDSGRRSTMQSHIAPRIQRMTFVSAWAEVGNASRGMCLDRCSTNCSPARGSRQADLLKFIATNTPRKTRDRRPRL